MALLLPIRPIFFREGLLMREFMLMTLMYLTLNDSGILSGEKILFKSCLALHTKGLTRLKL